MLWPSAKVYWSSCGLMLTLLDALGVVQAVHLDLVVEMADVTDDGLVFHLQHVLERDDVAVAGGGDVDVAAAERVFDRGDFEAFHRGLQGVDGIDLGDDDARAEAAERMRASLCRRRRNRRRTATLPAIMTSVARLMPSASDSRQP